MQSAHRNRLQVPVKVLSMYRALLTAEAVARHLGTDVDLGQAGRRFFEKLRVEEAIKLLEPKSIEPVLLNTLNLWHDSPGQVQQILSGLSDGWFSLNVSVTEVPRVTRARDRRTRLIAISILSVSLALLLAVPGLPSIFGVPLKGILGFVLFLVYLSTYVQWRRLK